MTENRTRSYNDIPSKGTGGSGIRRGMIERMAYVAEREKNSNRSTKQVRRTKETLAAAIVIMAMLVCMAAVIISILFSDRGTDADAPARQTAGTPIRLGNAGQQALLAESQEGSDFQQLSDPFLVLVNDEIPMPDNWEVTPSFIGEESVDIRIYNQLSSMISAAQNDGVSLWICSGYRSVEEQEIILDRDVELHMSEGMSRDDAMALALRTIARPGHSEHHTGFVIDLNDVSDNFEETGAYEWLCQNAADYGFVQRYRSDKVDITGIDNESWHYRYVGVENAQKMGELDMCLEEYVQYLKDQGVQ